MVLRNESLPNEVDLTNYAGTAEQVPSPNIFSLLKRGKMELEDSRWDKAQTSFDSVLNIDPENHDAHLGYYMARLHYKHIDSFVEAYIDHPIIDAPEIRRAKQFANTEQKLWWSNLDMRREEAGLKKEKIEHERAVISAHKLKEDAQMVVSALQEQKRKIQIEKILVLARQREEIDALEKKAVQLQSERESFGIALSRNKRMKREDLDRHIRIAQSNISDAKEKAKTTEKRLDGFAKLSHIEQYETLKKENVYELQELLTKLSPNSSIDSKYSKAKSALINNPQIAGFIIENYPSTTNDPIISTLLAENGGCCTVFFGHYTQKKTGIPLPIEWYIIHRSSTHLTLLSRYGIDSMNYDDKVYQNSYEGSDHTWDYSRLSQWLKYHFLKDAFDESEREKIAGEPTLLMKKELDKLQPEMIECAPVDSSTNSSESNSLWWIINCGGPGHAFRYESYATAVCKRDNSIFLSEELKTKRLLVRPVITIRNGVFD